MGRLRTDSRWVAAALVAAYGVVATTTLCLLVWSSLLLTQRESLRGVLAGQVPGILVGASLAVVGLFALVGHLLGRYPVTVRRLAACLLYTSPSPRDGL